MANPPNSINEAKSAEILAIMSVVSGPLNRMISGTEVFPDGLNVGEACLSFVTKFDENFSTRRSITCDCVPFG